MIKKNMFLFLILFFVLLFVGVLIYYLIQINSPSNRIPSIKITEIATISEIVPKGDYGVIFVERDVYKAYVTINEKTVITDSRNTKGLTFKDLKVGQKVEITVPEIIIEIYPYQYDTERIVILD
jgi:hypothetical protein